MSRVPFYLAVSGCIVLAVTVSAQTPDLGDLVDPSDPSSALDLTDVPLGISLLQLGALTFRDATLKSNFNQQMTAITDKIESAVGEKKLGYLVKVEMYSDEFGTPVIPEGQVVFPIGVGTEPVDALAEFHRVPRIEKSPKAGLRNDSYYLWITKPGGKYSAGVIRREFRGILEKRSAEEAQRRDLLGAWKEAMPPNGLQSVKRAAYWQEVAQKYANDLASDEKKKKFEALNRQFAEAQKQFNAAYQAFQETEVELARQKDFSQALQVASTLAGVVDTACRLHSLESTSGKAASSEGTPQFRVQETTKQVQTQIGNTTIQYKEQLRIITTKENGLVKRDAELKQLFQGIPIPKAEEPLVPKP